MTIVLTKEAKKEVEEFEIPKVPIMFETLFGPRIKSISNTCEINLLFNFAFELKYLKDLQERKDLFEVSVTGDHDFTYTYQV